MSAGRELLRSADPTVTAAISFGLTGTTDNSQPVFVNGLTAAMIQVTPESVDPLAGSAGPYGSGCVGFASCSMETPPDQIVVSIPNGYMLMRESHLFRSYGYRLLETDG